MLLTHVSLLIDRLHNKISYQNPLANELNITYPMMFNIALLIFVAMLHEKYNVEVTFDEIGFVAMHFCITYGKGKTRLNCYLIIVLELFVHQVVEVLI